MKYNKQQLKIMARTALNAKANNDERYIRLIVSILLVTGLPEHVIEQKIIHLAEA